MWRAWSWGNIYIDFDIISTNYTARLRADMLTHSDETTVGVCWLCIQCIPALKYMYSLERLATWGQGSPSCAQKCTLFWVFPLHKVTPPPAQSWLSPNGRHHVFSYPGQIGKPCNYPKTDRKKSTVSTQDRQEKYIKLTTWIGHVWTQVVTLWSPSLSFTSLPLP